jgi:tRNA (guanine-N7-)-methyltransferase
MEIKSKWSNPYIAKVADARHRILVNSLQPTLEDFTPVKELLNRSKEVYLEAGCGSGMHLLALARANLDLTFIGVELRYKRLSSLSSGADKDGLSNVYGVRADMQHFGKLLPATSLNGIFMRFPDPWPRAKWVKKRMFNKAFLTDCTFSLKEGGFISFKSDHREYFEEAKTLVTEHSSFILRNERVSLIGSNEAFSEFELLFRAKGIPYFEFLAIKTPILSS